MEKLTIGADPEFFLWDKDLKKHVSAHGLVPGTKEKPHKLKNGACQLDGTAVEFNITPAASSYEFAHNIGSVLSQLRDMIPAKYEFRFEPSVMYDPDTWAKIPDSSKELGCSPDYDALGAKPEKARVPGKLPQQYETLRTGAGHIHVGWTQDKNPMDKSHFWDSTKVMINMFYSFKTPSFLWDTDKTRNLLYGKGAAFRPKPYGAEFRSPSNAWLNYPGLWEWIFDSTKTVFKIMKSGENVRRNHMWVKPEIKQINDHLKDIGLPKIPEDWKENEYGKAIQ